MGSVMQLKSLRMPLVVDQTQHNGGDEETTHQQYLDVSQTIAVLWSCEHNFPFLWSEGHIELVSNKPEQNRRINSASYTLKA